MAFAFRKLCKIAHLLITNNSLYNIYARIGKKMWNDYLVWKDDLANKRMELGFLSRTQLIQANNSSKLGHVLNAALQLKPSNLVVW